MRFYNRISAKTWLFIAMIGIVVFFSFGTLIGLIVGMFKFVLFTFIDIILAIIHVFAGMIVTADHAFGAYIGGPLGAMGYIVLAVLIAVPMFKYYKNSQLKNTISAADIDSGMPNKPKF